jgi:hypothetical protein
MKEILNTHHIEPVAIPSHFIFRFVDLREFYSNINPICNSRLIGVLQSIIETKTIDLEQADFLYEIAHGFIKFEFDLQNLFEESSETLGIYGSNYSFGWNWISVQLFIFEHFDKKNKKIL